jgi:hypothetical protein
VLTCELAPVSRKTADACKSRHLRTHSKMKGLMAPPRAYGTIFRDREDVGLVSYRLFQRETSLAVRQRFIVGPDDE